MNIFFDLDGTLIDSRGRLYELFQNLVPQSRFSFDEYWEFKKNKIGHQQILKDHFNYSETEFEVFNTTWLNCIEQPEWLLHDRPFDGVTEYLDKTRQDHELFIITARQFTARTVDQISEYGWSDFFTRILVTNHRIEKSDLIVKSVSVNENDWIVGDTGQEILAGKKMGIKTAAVLSGFLSKSVLEHYQPDKLVQYVTDLHF